MKRTKVIRLVLLGGGVATMMAACGDNRAREEACARAKAELRADAAEICRRSSSSSTSRSSYWGGWSTGRTSTAAAGVAASTLSSASSRGGFGSTARSFSSGG